MEKYSPFHQGYSKQFSKLRHHLLYEINFPFPIISFLSLIYVSFSSKINTVRQGYLGHFSFYFQFQFHDDFKPKILRQSFETYIRQDRRKGGNFSRGQDIGGPEPWQSKIYGYIINKFGLKIIKVFHNSSPAKGPQRRRIEAVIFTGLRTQRGPGRARITLFQVISWYFGTKKPEISNNFEPCVS